jgi:hypothetical protein
MGRTATLIAAAVLAAILIGSGVVFWQAGFGFHHCQADNEVSARDRVAATEASRAFIDRIRAGETNAVLESMSRAGQQLSQRAALLQIVEMTVANPGGEPELQHIYSLRSIGAARGFAPCSGVNGVAFVARGGGAHTLFTILGEPIDGGERGWTFWLEREDGVWRVRGMHVGLSVLAGRDGARLWAMAEEQRRQDQVFNSTLLYDLANTALYRGGFLQPAEAYGFAHARELWRRHQDVIQARFHLGGETFPIASMRAHATAEGAFVLVLDQAMEQPVTVDEAIARNRALIDAMNAHRPEWRDIFDALAVGSPTGPNRLWRTLYDREDGYRMETETL